MNIDPIKGCMETIYITTIFSENVQKTGVSQFNFHRKNDNCPPSRISGYSMELDMRNAVQSEEIKVSELPSAFTNEQLIEKAQAFYAADMAARVTTKACTI